MSAPRIILASLSSFCQKLTNWWKSSEVLTQAILHSFLRHGVNGPNQARHTCKQKWQTCAPYLLEATDTPTKDTLIIRL